jgi:hypothetical protein
MWEVEEVGEASLESERLTEEGAKVWAELREMGE